MSFHRVFEWLLKIFVLILCLSQIGLYSVLTVEEYKEFGHNSDPIDKRIFLMNKTIYYTLIMVCLISCLLSGQFFLQSSTIALFYIWITQHMKNPSILWTGTVVQIVDYVLLLSVIIVGQLFAFTLSSRSNTEYIPYFPSSKANDISFKRKVTRNGSINSYTRNVNSITGIISSFDSILFILICFPLHFSRFLSQ